MTSVVTEPSPPAAPRSRWLALIVLCLAMLMIILDQTIVNVALPAIRTDLGFSQADLAWVVNAYLIAFGGLLLLAGRLGDLLGRKRVFLAGLIIFTLASLWCGLAGSQQALIAARFVQGIGAALAAAVALGMVVTLFPEPRERARAIGVYSFVAAAGASIGLLAGGVLTQALSWHWIFLVNVPIGLAATIAGVALLVAFVLTVAVDDIAAYFAGTSFGRRRLAPSISPAKSWEGAVAGFAGALVAGLVAGALVDELSVVEGLGLGTVCGLFAPMGDLVESLFKRELGIKDSGRLLPGHGGMLDRLDAIIFCAAPVYLYFLLLGL
jgi:CDP-diglyceride synthetase